MAKSTLTITVNQTKKTLLIVGMAAVKETVEVTIVGGAALIAEGLVLRIQDKDAGGDGTPLAQFPLGPASWTVSGEDAFCELNLNTVELVAAFSSTGNIEFGKFNILIYTLDGPTLVANGIIDIINFPAATTATPVSVDQQASIETFDGRITVLEGEMAEVSKYTDFAGLDATPSTLREMTDAYKALLNVLQGN
jgi:hypothetical protein